MNILGSIIETLNQEGKTVITITHDMEFVVNQFERVIVIANKKKIADTNKREVFWDIKILEQAILKQPHVSQLNHSLKIGRRSLNIEEMINKLKKEKLRLKKYEH
ncbi:hypothetical protein [Scopulibacillus cellulosilyticus]|uniref:Energy-coupling factor transport system ATP-binding protein n=1 Tax=Scopulibacillus cellulosilyticus TaxID=2665665 RepID=A0ABW2PRP7_9BACL